MTPAQLGALGEQHIAANSDTPSARPVRGTTADLMAFAG